MSATSFLSPIDPAAVSAALNGISLHANQEKKPATLITLSDGRSIPVHIMPLENPVTLPNGQTIYGVYTLCQKGQILKALQDNDTGQILRVLERQGLTATTPLTPGIKAELQGKATLYKVDSMSGMDARLSPEDIVWTRIYHRL